VIETVLREHRALERKLRDAEARLASAGSAELGSSERAYEVALHAYEQAGGDRPTGILDIYAKLVQQKGIHETEHAMMECLGQTLWNAQRHDAMPDENAYLACLRQL
ncbi:MAG: DUF1841 family protein, partial [Proteobacteria bacterium]|nr:DUF1841 family protein [Pseudomonadota bacterium]